MTTRRAHTNTLTLTHLHQKPATTTPSQRNDRSVRVDRREDGRLGGGERVASSEVHPHFYPRIKKKNLSRSIKKKNICWDEAKSNDRFIIFSRFNQQCGIPVLKFDLHEELTYSSVRPFIKKHVIEHIRRSALNRTSAQIQSWGALTRTTADRRLKGGTVYHDHVPTPPTSLPASYSRQGERQHFTLL